MNVEKERQIVRERWLAKQGIPEKGSGHMDVWSKADRETRVRNLNSKWMSKTILSGVP